MSDVRSQTSEIVSDTVREQVLVAVHDTIREVTTITVHQNEMGDTVFRSMVTDRERVREHTALKDKEEKVMVRIDTVYVERRDSVLVSTKPLTDGTIVRKPAWMLGLKWIFCIIIAVTVLIVVIKVVKVFSV